MHEKDKQKIRKDVERSFIERVGSAISEKITYCIKSGFSEDDAHHTVIQVVKNLPNYLNYFLSLKAVLANEDIYSDELIPAGKISVGKTFPEWPPEDVSDSD
ncbi:MAG: hypothetical protein KGJ58_03100 [Patescibacteria group bacterium]|nr:hypothetical protein [Patescibacteria group bacterium]MDE1988266.1 hypothetical protein [Patescibacteria group bacterium]MDE2218412.1 hypothetical protein [Patescibacteria group bacterium]